MTISHDQGILLYRTHLKVGDKTFVYKDIPNAKPGRLKRLANDGFIQKVGRDAKGIAIYEISFNGMQAIKHLQNQGITAGQP